MNIFTSLDRRSLLRVSTISTACIAITCSISGCKSWFDKSKEVGDMSVTAKTSISQKYIGELTGHWGMNHLPVNGVALITQLDDTGCDPMPSGQRDEILADMKSRKIQDAKGILAGKDTAIVAIRGFLPPGAKKGDVFDLQLQPIYNSQATSFQDGYVMQTRLRPMSQMGGGVREGRVAGYANGRVLVEAALSDDQSPQNLLKGIVVGGGVVKDDRPLGLAVRDEAKSIEATKAIGRAINTRFTVVKNGQRSGIATPKNDRSVEMEVADGYEHNVGHFMRVVVNVVISETEAQRLDRIETLSRELDEPALASQAAIRLEAIGTLAIPRLQNALAHQHPDVRFFAAQSLSYLGKNDGVEILEHTASSNPKLRWNALQALVAINDRTATNALVRLLDSESVETRIGAFRALLKQSPDEPTIQGQQLSSEYYLHLVPSRSAPMIHVSTHERAEICLFGNEILFRDNFLYVDGKSGLTIKSIGNGQVEIIQYTTNGKKNLVVSSRVVDVIAALGSRRMGYSKLLSMLKSADKDGSLGAPLVINALPKPNRGSDFELESDSRWDGVRQPPRTNLADTSDLVPVGTGSGSYIAPEPEKKSLWNRLTGLWSDDSGE